MMDEKQQARKEVREQRYMQDKLREFIEARQDKSAQDVPSLSAQFDESERLTNGLAEIRNDLFHYGHGYDHHMDGMVVSPMAILDAVRQVLEAVGQENINAHLKAVEDKMFADE